MDWFVPPRLTMRALGGKNVIPHHRADINACRGASSQDSPTGTSPNYCRNFRRLFCSSQQNR